MYKGTHYFGWEKQVGQNSVQAELEKAIGKILNTEINIYGSGRTDAGVHASGQTFHFDIKEEKYSADELMYRINCVLPVDIKLTSLEYLNDEEFHSRYSAKSKEYQYRISLNAKQPFRYDVCWLLRTSEFDMDLFTQAIKKFEGKHNFKNFTSKEEDKDDFVRKIFEINVGFDGENEEITVNFIGDGFMRYQIRYMVGTAVAIATKKEKISFINEKLNETKRRSIVSYKAQPQGLCLVKVNYK